ncbi:MAG TPA: CHAP domain-containing protein [Candidatus Binatia bacterium]|nr:CHAP domain-containing protein [Candidatus Binatia bacterium]
MRALICAVRRLALALLLTGAVAVLIAPSARVALPSFRLADSYDQQIAALQAKYASIGSQIKGLQGQQAAVSGQVAALQGKVAQTQASLDAVESQITQLNTQLANTDAQIQVDTARLDKDQGQLSQVMVAIYTTGGTSVVAGLVDSRSIDDFMNKLDSATTVSQKFQQLIAAVQADEAALQALKQSQQTQLAAANQAEQQLQALEAQLQAQEAQLQQEERSLTGQAAQLVSQRQSIMGQINKVRAEQRAAEEAAAAAAAAAAARGHITTNGALPPFAFGPTNDLFPWGQCTWYVASLRNVTWSGNADQWFGNAAAQGVPTGGSPRPGSIVVWGPGNGYSGFGHVAYVVGVAGPSDFTVDEANYFEVPGVLDQREVTTLQDVEGFIY